MGSEPILVHLGMPKTGTSSLQTAVSWAQDDPRLARVLYPRFGRDAKAHHALARDLGEAGEGGAAELARSLIAAIGHEHESRPSASIVFISSEGFTNVTGRGVAAGLEAFVGELDRHRPTTTRIVIRELSTFFESMYLQSARFGNITMSFEEYLAGRWKWVRDFMLGQLYLVERLGSRYGVEFMRRDFDVLEVFGELLDCGADVLRAAIATAPSTATPTLKQQVALMHLERLEDDLGFPVRRSALSVLFGHERFFEDDVERYVLIAPDDRRAISDRARAQAAELGWSGYATAFPDVSAPDLPVVRVDYEALADGDLDALRARRERIVDPKRTS